MDSICYTSKQVHIFFKTHNIVLYSYCQGKTHGPRKKNSKCPVTFNCLHVFTLSLRLESVTCNETSLIQTLSNIHQMDREGTGILEQILFAKHISAPQVIMSKRCLSFLPPAVKEQPILSFSLLHKTKGGSPSPFFNSLPTQLWVMLKVCCAEQPQPLWLFKGSLFL